MVILLNERKKKNDLMVILWKEINDIDEYGDYGCYVDREKEENGGDEVYSDIFWILWNENKRLKVRAYARYGRIWKKICKY